jgi:C-terminal processing protease CtpA/Prc
MPSQLRLSLLGIAWSVPLLAQQIAPVERARIAAAVWAEARYNDPAWDRIHADWDSGFADVLSAANGREPPLAYFRRLQRLVALLDDGQAMIVPPAAIAGRWGRPPVVLRSVERRPFLVDFADNDELRVAHPQRNTEILAVQGIPAERWIRDSVLPQIAASTDAARWDLAVGRMLDGEKGTALHLLLRLPGGEERGASVTRSVSLLDRWPLAPVPLQVDTLADSIVWVRLSSFADPGVARAFDRAFPDFAAVRGMILDLREHDGVGGGRETGYRILGRLVRRPLLTSRWRTPQYRPAYRGQDMPDSAGAWFAAPPDTIAPRSDLPVFPGPVAMLSSSRTGGSAEDMLIAYRNAGRGPIIGEPSAGSAGQVSELRLHRDWRLRLTVTRDAFPDGTEIQGIGIAPELPVDVSVSEFLAGKDAPLDRAREYIVNRSTHAP